MTRSHPAPVLPVYVVTCAATSSETADELLQAFSDFPESVVHFLDPEDAVPPLGAVIFVLDAPQDEEGLRATDIEMHRVVSRAIQAFNARLAGQIVFVVKMEGPRTGPGKVQELWRALLQSVPFQASRMGPLNGISLVVAEEIGLHLGQIG